MALTQNTTTQKPNYLGAQLSGCAFVSSLQASMHSDHLMRKEINQGRLREQCMRLTQVLWDEFITAVHNEDTPDIQLDVVLFLLVFKEVKWGPTGDEQKCPEFQLSLY